MDTIDVKTFLDNASDNLTSQFLTLLSSFNLTQHVNFPIHDRNHTLDLVITSSDTSLAPSLFSSHFSPSDHSPVFTKLSIEPTPLPPAKLHLSSYLRFFSTVLTNSQTLIRFLPGFLRYVLCPYSYHNQHRQSVTHLRSFPSYSQRICHLPTSEKNLL